MRPLSLVLVFVMVPLASGTTLVVTPSGYWNLTVGADGVPVLTKFDEVIRMTNGPTDPDNPDPDPTTLTGKVRKWAAEVDEPRTSAAQGVMMEMIAAQGQRGTFRTKSRMAEFTKEAIPKTIKAAESTKTAEWLAVWDDKIWPEVRAIEAAGEMNTVNDMSLVWEDIAAGFKPVTATWQVEFGTVGGNKTLVVKGEVGERPFLELILKLLMQFLLDWLGSNPFNPR